MPVSIDREIASLRNVPGQNWVALAFQKLQAAVNEMTPATAAPPSITFTTPKLTTFSEPVLPNPPPPPAAPSGPSIILVNSNNDSIGSGTKVIAVTINSNIASITTVLQPLTAVLTMIQTLTLPTLGGYVKIWAGAQLYTSGVASAVQLQLYKGNNTGTLLYDTGPNGIWVITGNVGVGWSLPPQIDNSPAASQLYTLYAAIGNGSGQADQIELVAENTRA